MDRATIVYNPAARNAPPLDRLEDAASGLRGAGWQIDLRATDATGHAIELARDAVKAGVSAVFACGGDGTVNEVVNGLAGSETALGVLRGGMGDVFAKEIGVPRKPDAALRVLMDGTRRRFDLGRAGERYFICMCGIGFDAAVVQRVPDGAKRRVGSASYVLWGLRELVHWRPRRAKLRIDRDDHEVELFWALLGNTRSYGGVLDITSEAVVDDGLLDAYVFGGSGATWLASTAARIALRRHDGARGVSFQRVREFQVETAGLPVQADGEYFGETPMHFEAAPAAVDVLLPRGRSDRLFLERP